MTSFEDHRAQLRGMALRMLGNEADADDAVQEAWLRLQRAGEVDNLGAWLTTVTARVCLDLLRARKRRGEGPLPDELGATEPPLADAIGPALLVVLETLTPAERLAFVLHDLFAMPFDEIAPIVGRSTAAARQLASRARRRVQGASAPEVELATQRRLVDSFIAALRAGDMQALVAVLDPDVVVRFDDGASQIRGAREWARGAVAFQRFAEHIRPVLIDGRVALALAPGGKLARVLVFGFAGATICDAEVITDPDALAELAIEDLP